MFLYLNRIAYTGGITMAQTVRLNAADWIAYILVIIGALNWGLVGIASFTQINYEWDLVALMFSQMPAVAAIIYILVGLAGIWILIRLFQMASDY